MNIKNYFTNILLLLAATLIANELPLEEKMWSISRGEENSVSFAKVDDNEVITFKHHKDSSYSLVYQKVNLIPDTDYVISYEIRTFGLKNIAGGIGARLFASNPKGDKIMIAGNPFLGDNDWKSEKYVFNSGKEKEIVIHFYLHQTTGTAEFRNIKLEKLSATVASQIDANLSNWQIITGQGATVALDNSVSYKGKASIKIEHPKHSTTFLKQLVEVEPNTNYILTTVASANAPMVSGGEFAYSGLTGFRPTIQNEKGETLAFGEPGGGIYAWKESSVAFNSKENRKVMLDVHFLDSKGSVHVGEIKFIKAENKDIGDVTPPDNSKLDFINKKVKDSGFIPFSMGAMEQAYSTRKPQAKEINIPLKGNAAIGEIEGIALGIYAFKPLEDVKLKFKGDLVSATGKTFSVNNLLVASQLGDLNT